jgi:hypothetical protein
MKARPTEYKGIRFRSKSEAVFARYLDLLLEEHATITHILCGGNILVQGGGGFRYEPATPVDGWHPDFLVWQPLVHGNDATSFWRSTPMLAMQFIEYKPSMPTKTYCEEWLEKVEDWKRTSKIEGSSYHLHTSFSIFFGSPFSDLSRGEIRFEDGFYHQDDFDWVDYFPCLMQYRFDLQSEAKR